MRRRSALAAVPFLRTRLCFYVFFEMTPINGRACFTEKRESPGLRSGKGSNGVRTAPAGNGQLKKTGTKDGLGR